MLILALFPNANMQAQWRYGAFAGMNYSGYCAPSGCSDYDELSWNGVFGIRLEYGCSERVSIFAAPQRIQKNADGFLLDEIEFPIGAKYVFSEGILIPYVSAGGSVAVILNPGHYTIEPFDMGAPVERQLFKNFDYLLHAGVGVEWARLFTFETRYSRGITSIGAEDSSIGLYSEDWTITLGFLIR